MAAESNTGFHRDETLSSALNRHAISFQSTATTSSSEMMTMGNYFGVNNASAIMFSGNSSVVNNNNNHPVISQATNSSGSLLLDTVPGLKHDAGLAVEWSVEEQFKLEEGLVMFADEPSILRYIKIAATLRDKTVRDVALRCRWMTRKRRKPEEPIGKKVNNRKDKLVEPSLKINTPSASGPSMAAYSHMMHHMNRKERTPSEVSEISSAAAHLLEQNAQAFSQITSNLSMYKLQDNIDLFCRTRNNIIAILNDMRETPGIMSKMLPLPVSINEDLANRILPSTTWATTKKYKQEEDNDDDDDDNDDVRLIGRLAPAWPPAAQSDEIMMVEKKRVFDLDVMSVSSPSTHKLLTGKLSVNCRYIGWEI